MRLQAVLICTLAACLLFLPDAARAGSNEGAAGFSRQAADLLARADFDGALNAYREAAKADPENQEYRQQYALVRRIAKMRESIDKEQNPQKWETTARALRSFYYNHGLFGEALPVDRQFHTKLNTAESATMLAETELKLDMNAEAADLLGGLDEQKQSPHTQALLGLALARQGKLDEARAIAEKCVLPDAAGPDLFFNVARMRALLGDASQALSLLVRTLEQTPPSRLEARVAEAKTCPDFANLVAAADFGKALKTPSKVKESGCSGGSSCGKCPSKSKCSAAKGESSTKVDH